MGVLVMGMVALLYLRTDLRRVPDVSLIEARHADPAGYPATPTPGLATAK